MKKDGTETRKNGSIITRIGSKTGYTGYHVQHMHSNGVLTESKSGPWDCLINARRDADGEYASNIRPVPIRLDICALLQRGYLMEFVAHIGPDDITDSVAFTFTADSVKRIDHKRKVITINAAEKDRLWG